MSLQGRVAIVTGAAQGIGRAIAEALAHAGADIVVADLDPSRSLETVKAIEALGRKALNVKVNVADANDAKAMAEQVIKAWGKIDILVNNAGITRDMTFKKMTKADWDAVMHTNLDSCFNMTKQVMDGMMERGWGRVINISSVNGQKGAFGQTNYSAAKAGMHGFTKSLALEVARKPAIAADPGEGAFDDPAPFVPSQGTAVLSSRSDSVLVVRSNQFDASSGQPLAQPPQIALGERLHVGVRDRGTGALVFLDLRQHVAGERDREVRRQFLQQRPDLPLVLRVGVGIEEAHRHRAHLLRLHLLHQRSDLPALRRLQNLAFGGRPLADLQPQGARHQRLRVFDLQVVDVVAQFVALTNLH